MLTLPLAEIRDLNARAVRTSVEIVSSVASSDLDRPTPCAEWTLGALLAHMTAQHHGFAAAAAGDGGDLTHWQVHPPGDDAVKAYAAAAERVLAAFADDHGLAGDLMLPELTTSRTFPAAQAIGFHFIDYVVHSWDLARSLGRPVTLDPEVTDTALAMAHAIPDGPARLAPGAAFRPAVPTPAGAAELDQVMALLGRSPTWPS